MKKLFLAMMLVCASAMAYAATGSFSYNFCISNVNDQVNEEPMTVTINISVDGDTRYDMCAVKLVNEYGQVVLDINCKVETGIVREKIYTTLTMKEMSKGEPSVPTARTWELKFLGDRARLYCVGGASYVFKNDASVQSAKTVAASEEETAPAEEENLNAEDDK